VSAVVIQGDARSLPLPDESVDLICTSPPYFGLRSYTDGGQVYDGQIGSEYTPQQYLEALWACTREWMRVLKPSGSIFVNLGDKYSTYTGANWGNGRSLDGFRGQAKVPHGGPVNAPGVYGIPYKSLMGLPWRYILGCIGTGSALDSTEVVKLLLRDVALGVCTLADAEQIVDELAMTPAPGLGLILHAEIIWFKPNGMPESAADRVRRSHEQVFHLVKDARSYYSAVDEIREPSTSRSPGHDAKRRERSDARMDHINGGRTSVMNALGKLPGSVWEIPSLPLIVPGYLGVDHFAAWPPALVRPVISGWSPPGICLECGQGRFPVTVADYDTQGRTTNGPQSLARRFESPGREVRAIRQTAITGYACSCTPCTNHPGTGEPSGPYGRHADAVAAGTYENVGAGWGGKSGLGDRPRVGPWREYHLTGWTPPPARPAVVLDPFGGTGTTALVADLLGRTGITVDRSADYCRLARWRTTNPGERARALGLPKPAPVPDGQGALFNAEGAAS
jgi:hypothetical protein